MKRRGRRRGPGIKVQDMVLGAVAAYVGMKTIDPKWVAAALKAVPVERHQCEGPGCGKDGAVTAWYCEEHVPSTSVWRRLGK